MKGLLSGSSYYDVSYWFICIFNLHICFTQNILLLFHN